MAFSVDPLQIANYKVIVEAHGRDAANAKKFAEDHLTIGEQPGLLADWVGTHEQVKNEVVQALGSLADLLAACGTELDRTVNMYFATDDAQAAQLDNTYPDPGKPAGLPELPGPVDEDGMSMVMSQNSPSMRLNEPKKPDGFTNPVQVINDVGNAISPGYWTGQFLDATIQVNPIQEAANWVAGDWEQFAKSADALNNLAWCTRDIADDLGGNITALTATWQGNSANEAAAYFRGVCDTIGDYSSGLATLRNKYMEAAKGVWEFSEAISDLIQSIFDSIFWGGMELVAGGVLAETVVAPAVLWSLAALECQSIVEDWGNVVKLLNHVQNAVRALHGGVLDVIGSRGSFTPHPLPAGYDHPGA